MFHSLMKIRVETTWIMNDPSGNILILSIYLLLLLTMHYWLLCL